MRAQGLLSNLDALVTQTKTQSSETLQTTEWRGRKVTVRPEKVRLFLLSIQDLDKSIEKARTPQAKIELIETMLIDCKDAITAVKDEMKQDPKLRQPDTNIPVSGIQYLLAYLSNIRLMRTLERNLYLVAQAKQSLDDTTTTTTVAGDGSANNKKVRPQDLTRLYEIISQNVAELKQISGMEDDSIYQKEIDVLSLSFKAFRCYYIAVTLVGMKRWKESVALYERSMKYAGDALRSKPKAFNLFTELQQLIGKIEACKFSAHAYSVLEDDVIGTGSGDETISYGKQQKLLTKPLFERLSQYKEDQQLNTKNPNVFKLTPDMQPIPCKPLFYDLAFNFVEFPTLYEQLDSPSSKKGAGISGFVKGFLGWGGNK